jgi:hypothetical protein
MDPLRIQLNNWKEKKKGEERNIEKNIGIT